MLFFLCRFEAVYQNFVFLPFYVEGEIPKNRFTNIFGLDWDLVIGVNYVCCHNSKTLKYFILDLCIVLL